MSIVNCPPINFYPCTENLLRFIKGYSLNIVPNEILINKYYKVNGKKKKCNQTYIIEKKTTNTQWSYSIYAETCNDR